MLSSPSLRNVNILVLIFVWLRCQFAYAFVAGGIRTHQQKSFLKSKFDTAVEVESRREVPSILRENSLKVFDTVVEVESRSEILCSLQADDLASLDNYMRLPVDHYGLIQMPFDSCLLKLETSLFELQVPPLQIFGMEFIPVIFCNVNPTADAVVIESNECLLSGPSFVEGLNESFKFHVKTKISWIDTPLRKQILSASELKVLVDPPGPFKRIPKNVLEKVGNTIMKVALKRIEKAFITSLAADYNRWAIDSAYRQSRVDRSS